MDNQAPREVRLSMADVAEICINRAAEIVDAPVGTTGNVQFVRATPDSQEFEVVVVLDRDGGE